MSYMSEDYSSLAQFANIDQTPIAERTFDVSGIGVGDTSGGGGGGGGGGPSESDLQRQADDAASARDAQQRNWEDQRAAAATRREQDQAMAQIKAIFNTYGLSSLYSKIEGYVRAGYNADTVALMLRETPEYQARFPAMKTLTSKGRAISEADYIGYEQGAAGLEQQYGLPKGMLMGNVTGLLEADVSVVELKDRVTLASAASLSAPQEFKDTLSKYYNIGSGGLAAYWLDPAIATPLLEKQYATAQIGAEALRQNIGLDLSIASELEGLGVTQEAARTGFGEVAKQSGFSSGAGDTASQEKLIKANVGGNAEAQKDVQRVAASRVGRFQQGGGFISDKGGASGLGSAATT
jgi:hypothetical protein